MFKSIKSGKIFEESSRDHIQMAITHRKRCSASLVVREMQIKTMTYNCTFLEWVIKTNQNI